MSRCNWNQRARSLAEREVGCPLDHCARGHHLDPDKRPDGTPYAPRGCEQCSVEGFCGDCGDRDHPGLTCDENAQDPETQRRLELEEQVAEAERKAGWDPNP